MRKVLRTAAMVVTALSIIGVTGTNAFATTGSTDPSATGTTNGNTVVDPTAATNGNTVFDPTATTTGTNSGTTNTGGGNADNTACNTTGVIINNGDDPTTDPDTAPDTTTAPDQDCPVTPAPTQPDTPGMGAGTPETPAVPAPAPAAPVAMTLPDTGADSFGNLTSTVLTMLATAGGLFVAGYRTLRGNL